MVGGKVLVGRKVNVITSILLFMIFPIVSK